MKTLKVKSILFSLLAMMAVAVFMASCEQGLEVVENEIISVEESQVMSRFCPDFSNQVAISLNKLIDAIQKFHLGRAGLDAVISAFDAYRLDVLEECLPGAVVVPPFVFTGTPTTCTFTPRACPDAAISSLEFFQCHLNNYLTAPEDDAFQNNMQNAFQNYIETLNSCFGINFDAEGWGNALNLP